MDCGGMIRRDNDRIAIFCQDRRKIAGTGVIGIAFVAMGISFAAQPEFWEGRRSAGWTLTPIFSIALIGVAVSLARPSMVELGLEGLTISTPWRRYSRPWGAVGDFRVWKY
jgi:hypothetical protein